MSPLLYLILGAAVTFLGMTYYRRDRRRRYEQMVRSELAALRAVQRLHLTAWRATLLMRDEERRLRDTG